MCLMQDDILLNPGSTYGHTSIFQPCWLTISLNQVPQITKHPMVLVSNCIDHKNAQIFILFPKPQTVRKECRYMRIESPIPTSVSPHPSSPWNSILTICRDLGGRHNPLWVEISQHTSGMLPSIRLQIYYRPVAIDQTRLQRGRYVSFVDLLPLSSRLTYIRYGHRTSRHQRREIRLCSHQSPNLHTKDPHGPARV